LKIFDRNLAARVGTAVVVLPLLLAAFFLAPPWVGTSVIAAAGLLALHEFFDLMRARALVPMVAAGWVAFLLSFAEVARAGTWPPLLPIAMVVLLGVALGRAANMEAGVTAAAVTLLGAVYLGVLGGCMAALILLPPPREGPWRIILLMAIVMTSDTFAFFAGKLWGRTKLAPLVSPGKTVAGAVGAIIGGVPPALVVCAWGLPRVPAWHASAIGVAIAILGMIGDLAESLLKRWAGVKDSGALFPGHGGMLDRLDSLLFGAPVLYYYFLWSAPA
jgi:phosphatidate cytidylyltransferase